ncbi:MAG: bifunctional lysylphosphatidylglycerol flippase/synthetase MprF [Sphaerochaetaceae bacterium]
MATGEEKEVRIKGIWAKLKPVCILAVLSLALYLLFDTLRNYHYRDLVRYVRGYPAGTIVVAMVLTCANYVVLTMYDVLGVRYVGRRLPYRNVGFASFMSYVFSYNIGLSLFGSSTMRYRFYSLWGVDARDIAKIVAFCVSSFWLGLCVLGGVSLCLSPSSLLPSVLGRFSRIIGVILMALVAGYAVACKKKVRGIHFRTFSLDFPPFSIASRQILVSVSDWLLAASVFYVLLPSGKPAFAVCVGIFIMAQLVGAVSHVPGGIGVFESMIMISLSPFIRSDLLFGTLITYRGIYYFSPLLVGIVAFVVHEGYALRKKIASGARARAEALAPFVPTALSLVVFICGAVLLFSVATPSIHARLAFLDPLVPLQLLELSHFASSLIGLALLFVADALRRRIDISYYATLALLGMGMVTSLLKGFDWEEALFLGCALAVLLPAHSLFYRKAALLSVGSGLPWAVALGTVLFVAVWLGVFSFKHVQYSGELWWEFALEKDAPRSLRAGLGVGVAAAAVTLRMLLSPVPKLSRIRREQCEDKLEAAMGYSARSCANLALLGDKYFFFSDDGTAFVMYGEVNNMFVVMGDPVGRKEAFASLLWSFYEITHREGVRTVWYEISSENIPVFIELGMHIFKIGETAMVDLQAFSLQGSAGRSIRPSWNRMVREGYAFAVLPREEAATRSDELHSVSNAWLEARKAKEKGFSLGFFDRAYLAQFPCAVVQKEGRIAAFANLWESGDGRELSVDLMRYDPSVPSGCMEYLFAQCMLWGKEKGYQRFDLGVAPMSGLGTGQDAPLWNKGINFLFQKGEGSYNFQGLHAFKDKFSPKWKPVYLAVPSSVPATALPLIAVGIAQLVGRGKPLPVGK